MLQRRTAEAGFVYYISPLLARLKIPHAFSTRIGGTSPAPFDSFNLGNPSGVAEQDDYARIYHHFDLLQKEVGCGDRQRLWVHQVHGAAVISIRPNDGFESGPKADAMVTDDATRTLSVRVADCVPVLLASSDGRVVAAVHAGWRGVIAGVVPRAIETMRTLDARSIIAVIGPAISFNAFEVGPEVLDAFQQKFQDPALIRRRADGKGYVDLRSAILRQLQQASVADRWIDTTDRCTFRDADEFFSHRRDKGITGRMAAIISPATT